MSTDLRGRFFTAELKKQGSDFFNSIGHEGTFALLANIVENRSLTV
ncbi:hypothetical protein [Paraburkholderia sp. BL6669N2]|nr:hypothetical protein [Paraburkholderia sp. BL6669N2]